MGLKLLVNYISYISAIERGIGKTIIHNNFLSKFPGLLDKYYAPVKWKHPICINLIRTSLHDVTYTYLPKVF